MGSSELTSLFDQEMEVFEENIEKLEKEKERIRMKARELKKKTWSQIGQPYNSMR